MSTPTEILYWDILPSIRSSIVFEMKSQGIKQNQIAQILEITPSAISQYLKQKRGKYEFDDTFLKLIKESTQRIILKKSSPFEETNFLIKEFERSGKLCQICSAKNNLNNCKSCF